MLTTVIITEEIVENEDLLGAIDGNNTIFTTSFDYVSGSVKLYLNGIRQRRGPSNDFIESGPNEITMAEAPTSGDVLIVDYQKQ